MQGGKNTGHEYVSVYLLDCPYAIDTSYDYFVPLELRSEISRGVFVTVPFGRTNRKQMAIVWDTMPASTYQNPKALSGICRDREPLSPEIMDVCEYMKSQCLCTMGDAVRCAVPAAALGKLEEYYSVVDGASPTPTSLTNSELFVYEHIVRKGTVSMDSLKGKFGAATAEESVQSLLARRLIERRLESSRVTCEAYRSLYSLSAQADADAYKLRSQKQKDIITLLSQCGELTLEEIMSRADVTESPVKALTEKGLVIKRRERVFRESLCADSPAVEYVLNDEQSEAYEKIKKKLNAGKPHAFLLHGITGSGKTSVIVRAIDEALAQGKGVIMLLPEIALTPHTLSIFRSRYGDRVALVHSGLSAGERYDAYSKIKMGLARVVVGTRSAIFSPVQDLGLIILDEEHEATYKSETSPKYHARDIARFRCASSGAVMLLSSATPSIESYKKAVEGKYELLRLTKRFGEACLPEVKIYDMRRESRVGNVSPLGAGLRDLLKQTVERGEQAVLFLNRRGYNTTVSCRSCGDVVTCPHCSVSMSYHAVRGNHEKGFMFCHWCGYKMPLPSSCPSCSSEHLARIGFGTQRIEDELSHLLPEAKILRMDADSTSGKNSTREIIERFAAGEADILLGTQMVTKGHDFPGVTLVGVLLADMSLYLDDYHANERTFSMLTQVIGRAGRADKPGVALIQTNNPDNDTIRLACRQDYESFYNSEIRLRKLLTFPPFCDIAVLSVVSSDERQALLTATKLKDELERLSKGEYSDVPIEAFGPFEAPVYKVEEKYRMRMIIKCRLNKRARQMFSDILCRFGKDGRDRTVIGVDFNPTGL